MVPKLKIWGQNGIPQSWSTITYKIVSTCNNKHNRLNALFHVRDIVKTFLSLFKIKNNF